MSIWFRIGDLATRVAQGARSGFGEIVETLKTTFAGDPELRRRVAFSIAMIALSAKMARADGIVTQDEVHAFHDIFAVPDDEMAHVRRLYNIAKGDIAGFETYARQMAGLCGSGSPNCAMLEDIVDGLFHIAKADGAVHEREVAFLHRIAEIFEIDEAHFHAILARHALTGEPDPYAVLGVDRSAPPAEIKARYRQLVTQHHPDRLIARGVPPEFVAIANDRIAAINAAYEAVERIKRRP